MTKKDYELIAKAIQDWTTFAMNKNVSLQRIMIKQLIATFSIVFQENNPRFDRDKFYQACGFQDGLS